jgi:putative Mg2+ transporter-C (MgtC) family protein
VTFDYEIIIKLLLATILGGLIGLERESLNRPAGFRTHILVCVGSTLTMLVSTFLYEMYSAVGVDPGRIAAQVVSGIGFLGAGTIIREGATVKGLTTAASLWTVASIGLAIGSGYYYGAAWATVLVFLTLISLAKVEDYIAKKRRYRSLSLIINDRPGQLGKIGLALGELNVGIKNIKMDHLSDHKISLEILIRVPSNLAIENIINKLLMLEGVDHAGTE